ERAAPIVECRALPPRRRSSRHYVDRDRQTIAAKPCRRKAACMAWPYFFGAPALGRPCRAFASSRRVFEGLFAVDFFVGLLASCCEAEPRDSINNRSRSATRPPGGAGLLSPRRRTIGTLSP